MSGASDDGGISLVEHSEVGTAGQCGGLPTQPEGVLIFDENGAAVGCPLSLLLIEQCPVAHQTLGLVEVRGWPRPVLIKGFGPVGPFAVVFAGGKAGQPSGYDVRMYATDGQDGTRGTGVCS